MKAIGREIGTKKVLNYLLLTTLAATDGMQ